MSEIIKEENNFDNEIKFLDLIYNDMIEAIHQKPDENDFEAMRLYMDNIWGVFNRTVFRVTEIKIVFRREKNSNTKPGIHKPSLTST